MTTPQQLQDITHSPTAAQDLCPSLGSLGSPADSLPLQLASPEPTPPPPCSAHTGALHFGQGSWVPASPLAPSSASAPLALWHPASETRPWAPPSHLGSRAGVPGPAHTLRLLVLVVEHDVSGMVEARCQVGDSLVPKLVDLEDAVVDVGDTVDVVLKDVNAERMAQPWGSKAGGRAGRGSMAGCSLIGGLGGFEARAFHPVRGGRCSGDSSASRLWSCYGAFNKENLLSLPSAEHPWLSAGVCPAAQPRPGVPGSWDFTPWQVPLLPAAPGGSRVLLTLLVVDGHNGVRAVKADAADDRELGVGPVQPLVVVVHSQA